jgi:hypothetical protein
LHLAHAAPFWRRGAASHLAAIEAATRPAISLPAREIFIRRLRNGCEPEMKTEAKKERSMKWTLMVLGVAMAAGCAHGSGVRSQTNELRGSAQVDAGGRMLLAGPAGSVHATVDGPHGVKLFVVDRVHGNDRDCHATPYTQWVTKSAHVEVGAKQALCAVAAGGSSFVLWHARVSENNSLWALQ